MSLWGKLRQEFIHAFAISPHHSPLTVEEYALLENISRLLTQRHLEAPALLFLESVGPLNFIGSQIVHGLRPFLDLVCETTELERLAVLLERRNSVDHLITLLQQQAASSA